MIFFTTKQVRIHKFLEKTKKKNVNEKNTEGEADPVAEEQEKLAKEQERLRKKVTKLMKKQKVQQVRMIVKGKDDLKPWGQDAHVKVFVFNFFVSLDWKSYANAARYGGSHVCILTTKNCLILVSITFQVGCRLIQLLIETAYIQPPIDQLGDGPPDIRPAFVHTLKTITREAQ